MDAYTPTEVVELISRAGVTKGNMRLDKVFFSSVSAGCLLAFACGTMLSTSTAPWLQENAPGLIRTIGALVFPYGLVMIVLTGADLCTGSFMVRLSLTLLFILPLTQSSSPQLPLSSADSPYPRCFFTGSSHSGGI